jgi:SpoVK/Ycf46/Vps4 family AAA+-type ATPase
VLVPFECLLIFATNLNPADLVEEAFLRRIRYKIHVANPSREQYDEIFRRVCRERQLQYAPEAVAFIYDEFYGRRGFEPRSCHPRDLLSHVVDLARYTNTASVLSEEKLNLACRAYFLEVAEASVPNGVRSRHRPRNSVPTDWRSADGPTSGWSGRSNLSPQGPGWIGRTHD